MSKPGWLKYCDIHARSDRHAHAGGHALSQRPGGGFDPRRPAIFRVPRTLAVELPEVLDIFQRDAQPAQSLILGIHRFHLAQVQHRVQQHGRVSHRQHEPVAIGPDRIVGIKAQELLPQGVDHGRHRHGRARMPGVGLLDRIHRQRPNGIDAYLVDISWYCLPGLGACGHESPSLGTLPGVSDGSDSRQRSRSSLTEHCSPFHGEGANEFPVSTLCSSFRPALYFPLDAIS